MRTLARNITTLMRTLLPALVFAALAVFLPVYTSAQSTSEPQQQGSVGIQGKISAPPPQTGATISVPTNGQSFSTLPITVSGICPGDVLVKIFKNNVFAGSVQCVNNSYSLLIDLFTGLNEITAKVYDALDQEGPVSNVVNVTYNDPSIPANNQLQLVSNYAKRGANPGEQLTWPISISGGTAPYALSIDWGDGSAPELLSQATAGGFNITHTYETSGVYKIIIRVTDKNGAVGYIQLVGVANGPISTALNTIGTAGAAGQGAGVDRTQLRVIFWLTLIMVPFVVSTFWLGRRHERHRTKILIKKGEYFKHF